MSHTNLCLGDNWADDWPDYVLVQKISNLSIESKKYVDYSSVYDSGYFDGNNDAQEVVRRFVRDMQSLPLGLVKVVFCKNCRWRDDDECTIYGIKINGDIETSYCNNGKRKKF